MVVLSNIDGGTANTPKTRDETVLTPNLNPFGVYKYPNLFYLMKQEKRMKTWGLECENFMKGCCNLFKVSKSLPPRDRRFQREG